MTQNLDQQSGVLPQLEIGESLTVVIKEVPLDIDLPVESIGMVMMQPFIDLDASREPFRWKSTKCPEQIERIRSTLALSKGGCGLQKVAFTIFPEYSIPGLEGVAAIQEILSNPDWPSNTVVVAGVDGMSQNDYRALCDSRATIVHETNTADRLRSDEWVNCCVTWVKSATGDLLRWVQPKLAPAQLEGNVVARSMYGGGSVWVFKGRFENGAECRFLSLVCYDWIDHNRGLWKVLGHFSQLEETTREVHILFVIQYNPKPNDNLFLENARKYFEEPTEHPTLNRQTGALIFANAAGGPSPGKHEFFGFSSVVFHPTAVFEKEGCPPTFAIDTVALRSAENLKRCRQALFREMGACAHSFGLRLPRWISANPTDRTHPLEFASVHPLDRLEGRDPRIPNGPVPAILKWFNDHATVIQPLLDTNSDVCGLLNTTREDVINLIRSQPVEKLEKTINMLSVSIGSRETAPVGDAHLDNRKWVSIGNRRRIHNVEGWKEEEKHCLEYLVHSLSMVKACKTLDITDSQTHATLRVDDDVYDIFVICGQSHQECDEHLSRISYAGSTSRKIILITINVVRPVLKRSPRSGIIGEAPSATNHDITDCAYHACSYVDLINLIHARDVPELCDQLNGVLGL